MVVEDRICRECEHYFFNKMYAEFTGNPGHRCRMVTGRHQMAPDREDFDRTCGPDGRLWVRKVPKVPKVGVLKRFWRWMQMQWWY